MISTFIFICFIAGISCSTPVGLRWTNWDGLQTSSPSMYFAPSSEEELISIIQFSNQHNQSLKVIGAGLSFSGIQLNADRGNMVSLSNYNNVLSIKPLDNGEALVEVQSGIRLRDLCEYLAVHKLALINLGATATQSIAGATGMSYPLLTSYAPTLYIYILSYRNSWYGNRSGQPGQSDPGCAGAGQPGACTHCG